MKTASLIFLALVLLVVVSEFDLRLKENSLLARYVLPFFTQSLGQGVTEIITGIETEFIDTEAEAARDPNPVGVELRRVIDGDTLDVYINGEVERIRYIGINTPEFQEPCYQEASLANRRLVEGQELTLERDVSDRDDFGRLLRYVFANGVLVQRQLVSLGFAEAVRYEPDDNYYQEFRELEQQAAEQGLGCHPSGIFDDGSLVR